MSDFEYLDDDEEEIISKTQIKKEAQLLQDLGIRLMEVKEGYWKNFPLSDRLLTALEESKRIPSHEAKRRHAQFVGRLMRSADIAEIEKQLDLLDSSSTVFQQVSSEVERWRELLLTQPDSLTDFITEFQPQDIQSLRQLIRATLKEQEKNDKEKQKADLQQRKPQFIVKSRKTLYKSLKQIISSK
ncbi:ribosome biogenesis factor YjgA [Marinicellulosiphila megalodicopiae]|uniref:ribosome biogenesis factor YjgA n=1 Tax=Marinicellulosiphila megalodicopiae TaxID=2724896 RepID=UPI003BB11C41